ncbi:hypothetical protein [Croceicoccus hydrothermalis]|uniref:hypothetical protein n=1 Tax=Croceicoccus hydrothermalis TaxID=2867964 RepID=UPI001EFAA987|nr:hypothetical protein [Croceicoccus hydrothermalis]
MDILRMSQGFIGLRPFEKTHDGVSAKMLGCAEAKVKLQQRLARPIHEATASCCSDGDVAVPD